MTEQLGIKFPQFYLTVPAPCPYLPDRLERKVFTQLKGSLAVPLNDALSHAGFRRSQNIAYKPACDACDACISVRIVADEFKPSASYRRVMRQNSNIQSSIVPPLATGAQFSILRAYLNLRHSGGGMSDMSVLDYSAMIEESAVNTQLIEYRLREENNFADHPDGRLVAVALTDILSDGLSMVYTFFEPGLSKRSLGTFMILDHIKRTLAEELSYVYLGYWVADCSKMDYKSRFKPIEALGSEGWQPLEAPPEALQQSQV